MMLLEVTGLLLDVIGKNIFYAASANNSKWN